MSYVLPARGYCRHGLGGGECETCSHMGELSWAETATTSLNTVKWLAIVGFIIWSYYAFIRPTVKSVKSVGEKSYKAFKAAQRELEDSK